jgi:Domain of unknown function (DUF5668)
MRSRSITGPLVLVIIGVVFLLNNLGHDIPLWSYLTEYWPFLLIGLGVIRLAEVLFHVGDGSSGRSCFAYLWESGARAAMEFTLDA